MNLELQLKANQEIFKLCKDLKINNKIKQHSHWFVSKTKYVSERICEELLKQSHEDTKILHIHYFQDDGEYVCELITKDVISLENFNETSKKLIELAKLFHIMYDGFEICVSDDPDAQYFKQ